MEELKRQIQELNEEEIYLVQRYIVERISDLYEMSFPRAKIEQKISDKADTILKHLIKVLYWEDKVNFSKHIHDIDNWLFEIQRLKPKTGTIESLMYFEWLFNEIVDSKGTIQYIIQNELKNYHNLTVLISLDELYEQLKVLYKEVAISLEKKSFSGILKLIKE